MVPNSPTARAFRRRLLDWYELAGRDLPWRHTREPYEILVSEFMLQQTQVARVLDAWPAFLRRFPDVEALAAAPVSDVITAWRGLGYNRRAVNLHRAAQAIVRDHGGRVPADATVLESLPGVGRYTARAVATFAFGVPVGPVDTNVARVLTRAVVGRAIARRDLEELADALAADGQGTAPAWSHALMDVGAQWCVARRPPDCEDCPVSGHCAWKRFGNPPPDPAAAVGSSPDAHHRFEGSDRYHRGRLVDALRERDVARAELGDAGGLAHDPPRLERIVAGLVEDGLAEWRRGRLGLPGADMESRRQPGKG